ncbi:hypothetical protein GGR21_001304 [Dysgonomonas hofstadii]|uniref:Uncharacterized protein n=1 Tax=Dysgonomonas hofstadii TaxID=637886 RepID=A0A840CJR0_9BACT|nr:hypothetical protein [Dysgonomonas hofstadii]MBB4035411.1 hypothetical protein [Dysgonomonas hofstadii]
MNEPPGRLEIKAMTREEFIKFLRDKGYQATISDTSEDYIDIKGITDEQLTELCGLYGTSGTSGKQSSKVGNWGCFSTKLETVPGHNPDVFQVSNELKRDYRIKVNTKNRIFE